jgi:hypothetical protein
VGVFGLFAEDSDEGVGEVLDQLLFLGAGDVAFGDE